MEKQMFDNNEHVIDYVDMMLLGDLRPELDWHVQAYYERQDRQRTQMWTPVGEVWWEL